MADLLLEKETIYAEDIEPILGPSAQSLKAKAEKAKEAEQAKQMQDGHTEQSQFKPTADNKAEQDVEPSEGVTISPEEPLA